MQKTVSLKLLPSEAADEAVILARIAEACSQPISAVNGFYPLKKSIDARGKTIYIHLTVCAFIHEPFHSRPLKSFSFKDVTQSRHKVIVIGAGPAGLFAALQLVELGIQPIVLERGKDVKSRRRDLAALNKTGVVNEESNYCFGEGGAGTYSDGKLYTRSNKRGDINRCLHLFVHFGADEKILFEAHPHIGTNKLPRIIAAMREHLIACGAEVLFEKKVVDFVIEKDVIKSVITADGNHFSGEAVILATGHSARDIFHLLYRKNILIESKPFALGVRIEHPQALINSIQYHQPVDHLNEKQNLESQFLPPASYTLVEQVAGKGVFSFCMCPGGIIAPAATSAGELVVNGWSPSKRNNPYSNSGLVVSVEIKDALRFFKQQTNLLKEIDEPKLSQSPEDHPLLLMYFQQIVERKAFNAGGGNMVAPAQRLVDFCNNKVSSTLPDCSYLPGVHSTSLQPVLPDFIYNNLQEGLKMFGKKMKGYYTNEALLVATESRTSSPVRIPRNKENLQHPRIKNLYPCAEGAGYAGGIISAAMDGEAVAQIIGSSIL